MAMLNKVLRYGLYLAVFLGGLVCSLYLTSKWIIQSEKEVLVPNLVGHDTVYALDLLTSLGLNIKVGGFMWSEGVPKNFIASQEPASGTRLKRDRDVKVVLSRGSRTVRVPNLVGTTLREAELVLTQNGLQLGGLCRVRSPNHPRDTILAQQPAPLEQLERGKSVDFLVSEGPISVAIAMPELRQRRVGQAMEILADLGLVAATVKDVYQPGQALETIVGQRPLAGYRVESDSAITLVVNRIPQQKEQQAKFWWVTYQVPEGYFNKEIALSQQQNGREIMLYCEIHPPGDEVEWLVWARSGKEVTVFVDGMLQKLESGEFHWHNLEGLSHWFSDDEIAPIPAQVPWRGQ